MKKLSFVFIVVVIVLVLLLIGSFSGKEQSSEVFETSEPLKTMPVRTVRLESGVFEETIELGCVISGWREVQVVSEAGGRVISCSATRGDRVQRGDTLLVFDDELPGCAMIEAEAGLEKASATAGMALRELERQKTLLSGANTSRTMYESAETAARGAQAGLSMAESGVARAERALRETRVASPFSGILDGMIPVVGMYLPPGQPLMTIIQDDPVKCLAGASAPDAVRLKKGMKAVLSVTAFPGTEFDGEVVAVGARSEPGSGAYTIEMKFSNRDGELKSGMAGSVSIIRRVLAGVKLVPAGVITSGESGSFIWTVDNGSSRRIGISELGRDRRRVAVECELEEGAPVVVVGHENLSSGMPVSVQPEKRRAGDVTR